MGRYTAVRKKEKMDGRREREREREKAGGRNKIAFVQERANDY